MSQRHSAGTKRYMLADALSAFLTWVLFFSYRKLSIEKIPLSEAQLLEDPKFLVGAGVITAYWWTIFTLSNQYYSIYEKSRLAEVIKTILYSLAGNILLFFMLILNDRIGSYQDYYKLFFVLSGIHILLTLGGRLILLFAAKNAMRSGKVSFETLWIGNHPKSEKIYRELLKSKGEHGLIVTCQVTEDQSNPPIAPEVTSYAGLGTLSSLLQNQRFDYAILAMSNEFQVKLPALIELLDEHAIRIKIIPELNDIISGQARLSNVTGTLLTDIQTHVMAPWERVIKRAIDLLSACLALTLLSPLYLYIAIAVKRSSSGPIIFSQERIGYRGRPFRMYKFRSMYCDAEANGPRLSQPEDERITPFGKFIRKYRLDELPQFYNVLKGEMSLVGPRPERAFFAEQIIDQAAHYKYIYKVKPGITSWGMIKYGYASDVEGMLERMQWDLLYVENFSLLLDLRILIHTVLIILKGRGM